ncbi:hypothetical protein BGZ80_008901 [Entomortierella chlamydospora]|uniref:DUF605-domain-containing protein n=1 Tax=Entomortierella chlamydospora TaxID=101097 RepID=A0A9P6N4F0_9FUNG|nr:hypothetical protein BGZ79_010432 [Entomortierella chlamydospora]KAG0024743.1 hypothetical protein BGZ80_008901 [Entomortierella chlamydospora]
MSAANVPESLKSIAPYLQRASQLQEREPIISYYCIVTTNYYAAKIAIPKAGQDNNRAFVMELLDTLEKQRKEIGDNEAISNDLVGYAYIENFALKIFGKADDEDRAGQGSQKTAKNFVAAANFLELLKVFGEVDSEVEKKIKYSKWRAAEIVKAIRDGRQPVPPPGADKPKEASPDVNTGIEGFESLNVGSNTVDNFFGNNNTAYTPANIPPVVPAVTQPGFGAGSAPSFPTITNFPDPPLGSSNQSNIHGDLNNSNINGNWSQPPISPNFNMNQNQDQNQGQNFYNPPGSLQPQQPQQPPSTYIPPAVSPSVMPSSGYMPTVSNPTSPPPSNAQFGYGNNSVNNNNFYQQPTAPSAAAPAPAPAPVPTQNPYTQPGFGTPSTPYQQPHQVPSPQVPYAAAPMVLDPAINAQVQKHCKWTVSALTYDDIPTAIDNLEKALALLRPYNNKQ